MKTVNGKQAMKLFENFVDEDYSRENFETMRYNLKENDLTFTVQALVSDDGETLYDYRIYDPYQHYCKGRYVGPSGYTHWQLESKESFEWEENN